jgi:AcrR family transcriptional regulator
MSTCINLTGSVAKVARAHLQTIARDLRYNPHRSVCFVKQNQARSQTRDRILESTDRLFYGKGIRAVGVDAIAAAAGVSKRTLYDYYPSKDHLIVAYLSRRMRPNRTSDGPPREQIFSIFEGLERALGTTTFRGCPFVNAVAELSEPTHPANEIAIAFKEQRRMWFSDLVQRIGVRNPGQLALQLAILLDGALALGLVLGDANVARAARAAAAILIDAAETR